MRTMLVHTHGYGTTIVQLDGEDTPDFDECLVLWSVCHVTG
jgi:hypothetical protein